MMSHDLTLKLHVWQVLRQMVPGPEQDILLQGSNGAIINVCHEARLGVEKGVWRLIISLEVLCLVGRL